MVRRRSRATERGFTLIEMMIALTVLTIALLGMLGLYRTSARSNMFARRFGEAHELAVARIEAMRPLALAAIEAQANQTTDFVEAGVTYHVVHRVDRDVGGNPNLFRITALASFAQDGDEAEQSTARLEVVRTTQEAL